MIQFDFTGTDPFLNKSQWEGLSRRAQAAHEAVLNGTGAGKEWLGWRRILKDPNDALLENIAAVGQEIASRADVLLCIGIGGSYLGSEAVIRALSPYFKPQPTDYQRPAVDVLFAGHNISATYLSQLLDSLEGKSVYVNVISKSGTTL